MPFVKLGVSSQVVIPKKLQKQLGFAPGDSLEVTLQGHQLILTPKNLIDKRFADGLQDLARGRTLGPFSSAKQAIRALRTRKKK